MWDACGVGRWCAGRAKNLLLIRCVVPFRPRVVTGRQELHQLEKGCMSQWGLWAQWCPDLEACEAILTARATVVSVAAVSIVADGKLKQFLIYQVVSGLCEKPSIAMRRTRKGRLWVRGS